VFDKVFIFLAVELEQEYAERTQVDYVEILEQVVDLLLPVVVHDVALLRVREVFEHLVYSIHVLQEVGEHLTVPLHNLQLEVELHDFLLVILVVVFVQKFLQDCSVVLGKFLQGVEVVEPILHFRLSLEVIVQSIEFRLLTLLVEGVDQRQKLLGKHYTLQRMLVIDAVLHEEVV